MRPRYIRGFGCAGRDKTFQTGTDKSQGDNSLRQVVSLLPFKYLRLRDLLISGGRAAVQLLLLI